jgi:hypothetical protein
MFDPELAKLGTQPGSRGVGACQKHARSRMNSSGLSASSISSSIGSLRIIRLVIGVFSGNNILALRIVRPRADFDKKAARG